jgi:hypothetical protein
VLISPTSAVASDVLYHIVTARTRADLEHYTTGLALDLTPPTDDRPFFFNMLPFHSPGQVYRIAVQAQGGRVGGAASVLATILAVATSIAFGIHVTLTVGALCYLLLVPAALLIGITWQTNRAGVQRTALHRNKAGRPSGGA